MALITDLPAASSLATTDLLIKDTGSATQKIAVSNAYADATHAGLVSTDSQSFGGVKTFAGRYVNIRAKDGYPALRFLNEAQGQLLGIVFPNITTVNGVSVCDRMYIRQYSYDSTTGEYINQWDQYTLPTATPDRTASANYSILTSKSPVTIAEGGTGQTATNHSTIATNMTLTAWGKNRMLDFDNYTISYATIVTLSDENRPNTVAHGICRWKHTNNTYYPALVTIASTGVVSASYWNGTSSAAISNGTLTGTISWIAK